MRPKAKAPRVIRLIDAISSESFKLFIEESSVLLAESKDPIEVELFSHGGSAEAALAFAAYMRLNPYFNITAYGEIASSAVLVLACGKVRRMTKEAWVMVHESSTKLRGTVTDLEREAEQLRRMESQWNEIMAERSKVTERSWSGMHKETTYLSAEECLELGLIDEIV